MSDLNQEKLEQIATEVYTEAMTGDFYYQVAYRVLGRAPVGYERRDIRDHLLRFVYERKVPWTGADMRSWVTTQQGMFGFHLDVLMDYMDAETARLYFKDGADLSNHVPKTQTWDTITGEMREYMGFAWDKARNHRGLSSSRSVTKMQAWLWLLGDDENLNFALNSSNYTNYGAPILKRICEAYGFPIPEDEGTRRMAEGLPCHDDCAEGCGQ